MRSAACNVHTEITAWSIGFGRLHPLAGCTLPMHGTPTAIREVLLHETNCGACKQLTYIAAANIHFLHTDVFYLEAVQLQQIRRHFEM